jgi:hypothetical protein
MPYVAPPSIPGDWDFEIIKEQTEIVECPWSCIHDFIRWDHGRTFCTVRMWPLAQKGVFLLERELVGHGFVLHGSQHRILRVITFIPMVVETQAVALSSVVGEEEPE